MVASAQSYHPRMLEIQANRFDVPGCGGNPRCDVFPAGAEVWIGVAIRNISDQPMTYRNIRWAPSIVSEVRDEFGNPVPETEELQKLKKEYFHDGEWIGRRGVQRWDGPRPDDITTLKPGGQVSWAISISKYYDVRRPGTYSITAKVWSDEPTRQWFHSNEIQVTVVPAVSQGDPIKVVTASIPLPERTGVVIAAELNGVPAKMTCHFGAGDCAMPEPGDYLFVAASAEASGYKGYDDCLNVYLYAKDKEGARDRRIGLFCLLP
jgi:hypothetical protein